MTKERDPQVSPDAERARAALRGIETPPVDAGFRERLKEEFVSGRIIDGRVVAAPIPWHTRPLFRAAAIAAAAVVAIVIGVLLNRGPAWTVSTTAGAGDVKVDGELIPIENVEEIRARVHPGVEVEVSSQAEVEIVSDRMLAIQLTPGTRLTVPPPPSRWFGRSTELHVRAGELRITTGWVFKGARLDIHTPDAVVHVIGTTLAVIIEPTGTCVCVLEGEVRMNKPGEEMQVVPAGKRGYAFRDDRPLMTEEIRPMEKSKLEMFRDARRPALGTKTR